MPPKHAIPVQDADRARELVKHDQNAQVVDAGKYGTYVLCDDHRTAVLVKAAEYDETKAALPIDRG